MLVDDLSLPAAAYLTGRDASDVVGAAVNGLGGTLWGLEAKAIQYRPGHDLVVQFRAEVTWAGDSTPRRDTLLAGVSADGVMPGTVPVTAEADGTELVVSLWRWPFDPFVPGIEEAVTPGRAETVLGPTVGSRSTREVVAYRPTERAVVRAVSEDGSRAVYLKAVRPAEARALAANHDAMISAGLPVPRVLGLDDAAGLVVMEEIVGTTLRQRIKDRLEPLIDPDELSSIIDGLGRLDATNLSHLPGRISDAVGHAALLERVAPAARPILDEVVPHFETARAASLERSGGAVHGDLHEGQLIVDGRGRATGLLDVDSAAVGDPLDDVVTLLGHLTYRAMRSDEFDPRLATLIESVRADGTRRFGSGLVALGTAAVLVGLATGPFRIQSPDWELETLRVLRAASDLLGQR